MSKQQNDCNPEKVKKWIAIVIAILSAIAGALSESATSFISNFLM